MEVTQPEWERWRNDDVTREVFEILVERRSKMAFALAEGGALIPIEREIIVGRCKEIVDLLNMTFEDTRQEKEE